MTAKATIAAVLARLVETRKAELQVLEELAAALAVENLEVRVSQRTSERVLGIPRRPFLELVRDYERAGGEVIATGKLRIVRVVAFEAWLRARSVPTTTAPANDADNIAAELGLVAAGGRR